MPASAREKILGGHAAKFYLSKRNRPGVDGPAWPHRDHDAADAARYCLMSEAATFDCAVTRKPLI